MNSFICNYQDTEGTCDKVYKHAQSLDRHRAEAHGGRRYRCGICGRAYVRNVQMLDHEDGCERAVPETDGAVREAPRDHCTHHDLLTPHYAALTHLNHTNPLDSSSSSSSSTCETQVHLPPNSIPGLESLSTAVEFSGTFYRTAPGIPVNEFFGGITPSDTMTVQGPRLFLSDEMPAEHEALMTLNTVEAHDNTLSEADLGVTTCKNVRAGLGDHHPSGTSSTIRAAHAPFNSKPVSRFYRPYSKDHGS